MVDEDGWDGGYEDLIDSGDGVDELYLGNYQRYDMGQGFIPDPRFATRPAVPGRRNRFDIDSVAAPESSIEPDGSSPTGLETRSIQVPDQAPSSATAAQPASKAETKRQRRSQAVALTATYFGASEDQIQVAVLGSMSIAERITKSGLSKDEVTAVSAKYAAEMRAMATDAPVGAQEAASTDTTNGSGSTRSASHSKTEPNLTSNRSAKAARNAARAAALDEVAAKYGFDPVLFLAAIEGAGSDNHRASYFNIEVSQIKSMRTDYFAAINALVGASPSTVRPIRRPNKRGRRKHKGGSRGAAPRPTDSQTCGSCGHRISMTGSCGCS